MARVSDETLERLNDFINSLPSELRNKCALCTETLTHIVKTAEVQTGAGTATVARVLSDRLNEDALPGDRVSGEQLRGRVQRSDGTICMERADKSNEHFRTSFTGDNEWYTPVKYIESAREVMGEIDVDPATSEYGQSRINAHIYYTKDNDGLEYSWHGRTWLNPPYSQPDISNFIEKLIVGFKNCNVSEAIVLTHNYTDTTWFHSLVSISSCLCFTRGRIKYEKEDGTIAAPTQGAAFFYCGPNSNKFKEIFQQYGFICKL